MQKRKKEELKYLKRKTYAALEALASARPGRNDRNSFWKGSRGF
jgi:hypothetical protein